MTRTVVRPSAPYYPRPAQAVPFVPAPPDGRPRVGLTTANFGYGGIEFWDRTLMAALDSLGYQCSGVVGATWQWADPRVTDWFSARVPIGAGRLDLHALARASDVVVCSGMVDAEAWMGGDRPCRSVLVAHGSCGWTRRVMRWGERADACIAVSRVAAATFPAGTPNVRVIHNIPHAKPPTRTRTSIREEWGVRDDQIVVGFLGRWAAEKRPEVPMRAMAHLPERYVYVAVGPYQEAVTRTTRRRLAGRFVAAGPTDDAGSALAGFDMLALPSLYEGFALVAAEAYAAGVPVIASRVGIVAERPEFARVVDGGAQPRAWAAAIEGMAYDPDLPARVAAAKAWADSHLTPERFAREWQAVLAPLVPATASLPATASA